VADPEILEPTSTITFDPAMVQVAEEFLGPTVPKPLLLDLQTEINGRSIEEAKEFLRPAYDQYVSTVSSGDMAVSLNTAALLYELCLRFAPASILDLGSGFSSYPLRAYASNRKGVHVFTVDDDPAWLVSTRQFLDRKGLRADNLMTWDAFELNPPPPADLVFHDLGSMATRLRTLPSALNYCRIGGIVLLDDMHKEEYAPWAEQVLIEGGFRAVDVREQTLDHFGRFCWIASKVI
jgi:predicted O-methyltransferase YrrM